MKKSIASVCLSGDLRQKFDAVSRAGFTGVEIFENDLMLFDEAPGVVKQMAKDYGLTIIALQPLRDFEAMPAEIMKKNFGRAERKFDLMAELGTPTEHFRHMHNGSGVQHIALRCNDILAFVKTVDPGIILSIPENYYDDLEARIDLDADLLASLKQYNLLYDSNDTGHFIHFYTHCVNGVFFEVMQRHKYSNYGEVNAQLRMASQARQRISGNNDE